MMQELARHGYDVGAGTLYPMLHQLEEAGYLTSSTEVVGGKQRKYYRSTPEGAAALESARAKLRELVAEVLHDRPPTTSIRSREAEGEIEVDPENWTVRGPGYVMGLPLESPGRAPRDRPPPGYGSPVTGGDAPRRRTGSRPTGPTPVRERVHSV
jgi:PadR family transcriptional regulator PadR